MLVTAEDRNSVKAVKIRERNGVELARVSAVDDAIEGLMRSAVDEAIAEINVELADKVESWNSRDVTRTAVSDVVAVSMSRRDDVSVAKSVTARFVVSSAAAKVFVV
jgi:hypothetical protein